MLRVDKVEAGDAPVLPIQISTSSTGNMTLIPLDSPNTSPCRLGD